MMTNVEDLIQENVNNEMLMMDYRRRVYELGEENKNLEEKYVRLEEEHKILQSYEAKRILELMCLKGTTDNVIKYTNIVNSLNESLSSWKYWQEKEWEDAHRRKIDDVMLENHRLKTKNTYLRLSFWLLYGSWLVLFIKALI